jgi:hypothetical protein
MLYFLELRALEVEALLNLNSLKPLNQDAINAVALPFLNSREMLSGNCNHEEEEIMLDDLLYELGNYASGDRNNGFIHEILPSLIASSTWILAEK